MIENNCNMTKFLKGLPFRKNNKNLRLNKNILSVEKYIIKSQQNKKIIMIKHISAILLKNYPYNRLECFVWKFRVIKKSSHNLSS